MNKTTEALKLAEEAFVEYRDNQYIKAPRKALAAIREVLAEPVKQEPVAWLCRRYNGTHYYLEHDPTETEKYHGFPLSTPLYAAPVDAKAIRAEALEGAEEIAKTIGGSFSVEFLAAIRGLK